MPTLNGLSDEGSETVREAREVVLFMHRNCRVSRNIRALWFFDHLNKCVAIEEAPANDDYGREIEIVGMVAKSGGEAQVGEQFKICSDTVVTYLSKLYRLVFVLDLSPSAVVADETSGCVLHVKLMECLRRCLVGVTRSFNFPGTKRQFSAQLYVSVCVYSPFICFDGDPVLLQGALLNADNVERTVEFIGAKLAFFTNKLCDCMRPHLRRWNRERRRVRKEADELIPGTFFRQQSTYPDDEQLEANCSLSASNECRRTSTTVNASDEGFIQPEWSLIFMLRMGLLGVQMLPENTRSSIIVITDAVCGMPDVNALQQLLTQLRSFTVSCSFIQLQKKNTEEPVFGLVSYPELFHFLAMATFGTYIPDCQCSFRDMRQSEMNAFHRALLCWSFQRALADNEHIRSLVNEINPDFADFYISDIVRRKHLSLEYETNLPNLLYVRMREGYTIKEIRFAEKGKEKNETFIVVELRLPWKPLVFIEYKITAPWPASNRREKVKVSLVFEAPYNVMKDLVSERRFASPQRQSAVDAFKNAIGNLLKADRLLIHIHSFNSHPDYFSLPSEVSKESALFRFLPNGSKSASAVTLLSRDLEAKCSQDASVNRFVEFWRLLCDLDEGIWQKWVHTHTIRIILVHDQRLPSNLFVPDMSTGVLAKVTAKDALTALHEALSQITTFPLVRGQSYVKLVVGEDPSRPPVFFYMIRTSMEAPCIALKIAFLGGISGVIRNKIVNDIKDAIMSLEVERCVYLTAMCEFSDSRDDSTIFTRASKDRAVIVLNRPMERILVRYKKIPVAVDRIVRLERAGSTNREMILHNSIAKYLCCRRQIWRMQKAFASAFSLTNASAEFILNTLLQRRLSEGFHISYGANGVVNLVRQVRPETDEYLGFAVEQYIIFPPSRINDGRGFDLPKASSVEPRFSSHILHENSEEFTSESYTQKSDADLQLITELWTEPLATTDEEAIQRTAQRYRQIRCADENIIRTLSTLDQLMTICVHHSSSQLQLDNSTLSGSTRSYVHDISNAIQLISNCFCLRTLLCNVLEREVILLPTLSYRDADPASISRLQILLESLHKELLSTNNVCIEVNDPKLWSQITADVDRNVFSSSSSFPVVHTSSPASPVASLGCSVSSVTETALTPLRVYVSRLSPWRLIVSVLPVLPQHVLAVTSAASPSIPLLVFHCDEPWIAYNLALLDPLPKALYVSDHRTKNTASTLAELNKQVHNIEIPKEDMSSRLLELHWLSEARICASEHRVHTLFNLRSYCETIEDQLFSRAFISAVYRALIEDIYVPSEDLIEATEDRCEQANIEIDDVDDCIRFLCSHVVELRKRTGSFAGILDYPSRSSSTNSLLDDNNARESAMDERSCEDEQEDYRLAFDELISKHFRKVPNLPNYFFYVKDAGVQLPLSQEGAQFRVKLGSGLTRGKVPLGSGGGVSRNSLSDDVEFSYVNDDVNNDFSPIHQQINESEDDELDEDERSSSPNESTSATCISESELLTADSSVDVAPLFLNFSCAIRFPNQTMHTFPIDHLPSCMIKLLRQCPDAPSNILSILDQVEVTLDVYVLSWPSMHAVNDHLDSVLTSPSSRLSSPVLPKDPVKYFDFENTPSVDAVDVMVELPQAENRAVHDLRLGISRLLQMEKNLVLSRYDDYRRDTLQKIIDFIVSECAEGNDPDRIKMAEVKIVLVMEPTKALRRLRDRIKQLKLDYCQLSAVPHTHNMFFCCNITDQKRFELTFNKMGPVHRASYISRRADNFPRSGSFSEGYEGRERDSRDSLSTKRSSHLSTGAVLENCDTTYTSKPLSRSSKEERNSVPLPLPSTEGLPKRKTSSVTSRVGTDDEQAFVEPCSRIRRQELNDFWLILAVDAHEAKIYFCQRYAHLHTSIFERLREAIEMECRTVNQELLLEKMQQTGECDSLLIASDSVSRKVGRDETFGSVPNTPLTRKYIYSHVVTSKRIHASSSEDEEGDTALAGCARVEYPPGHFACGIVDHHYFFIHPRLQQSKQAAGKSSSFAIGFEALRHGIERFAVRNRRNLYVFREEENANVFYMRLHMTEDSIRENARDPSQSQWMNNLGEMMRNNILLTVHGVRQPGSDLKAIIEAMQKRIDVKVLDEITSTLQKNPQARLTPEDVRFIQRDPSFPDAVFHCTLPNFTEDYLGSLYVYVQQQMLTFAIEARFREHSDGKNDAAFSERTHFYPYVTESNPLPPNYVTPFFVVNRPPSKGSANLGVACVEIRVVDIDGVCKTNLRYADLTTHTHSQLYPGGAKVRRAAVERFHELTRCINTSLPLPESLRSGAGKIAALMEFNVWQAGDVGLPSLHARFRLAVQQALCDLVTEFGLLSCPVFDLQAPFSPVLFRAPTVSVSKSRGGQHLPTLRKRSSSDALLGPTLISPSKTAQLSSVRLEQPAVLSRNEAIRRSAQSTQTMFNFDDTKRNSLTLISALSNTDGTPSSSSEDTNFTPTYVNCQFAAVAREWFDHMVSEVKNNTEQQFSLKKHMFHLDSDHSARKICRVIGERLCGIVCRETVTVCQLETNGSNRYCTLSCGESFIMPFCSDDGRVVDSEHVKISLMLIAFNHDYAEAVLRYGADCSERLLPDALAEVTSSGDNSFRFLPHVSPFVPRQHLLFFIVRGEVASLYLYNYSAKAAERIQKLFSSIISWHNGRSRLLREIGLHKMGITHLPASISPSCKGLVWLNAALLYKYDFPEEGTAEFDQQFINDVLEPSEARLRMKLYRHSNASFLAINLMPTFFEDQCEQMLMIENETSSLMRDHQRFRAVHQSLLAGSCEMSETDLILITMRSREVHFVKSPLLLFSRWRRRIAAIRISAETSNDFRHSLAEDPSARRASGSRLSKYEAPVHNASKFQFRSNTFSTTIEGFSKTSLTRIRRYTEEDDPCSLKIQFMLVESYVEYAKKLGWHFLTVKDVSPLNVRKNPYTLRYDTQNTECSPNVWLFKVAAGGIIFVQLTFVEPYFSVRILVWNASQLCNVIPIEDGGTAVVENLRELETIKDEMVSRGHVHSFTYDFHLRMVATYLVGGQQVLFNQGYNTNAFLIDFLQYYGCRPPYARNCIYEERVEFSHLPVNSTLIWEHFLVEKSSEWRVVRLKPLNTGASDQFMLVSEEPKEYLGQAYKAIRVVLHDQQAKAVRDCLAIKFYIILVASERTDPFVENVMFGSGAQACVEMGEFKEMESVREDENEIEDGNTSQFEFTTDTSESTTPCGRRRFCSGDHVPSLRAADITRKFSTDADSMLASRSVDRYAATNEDNPRLSIQKNAPRRHRKQVSKWHAQRMSEHGAVLPREQVIYVHYLSVRQRKLQEELEDSVVHYRLRLQKLVEDAGWHCKRDQLWNSMLECPTKRAEANTSGSSRKFFAESSTDVGAVLRNVTSTALSVSDIDKLLGYVRSKSMFDVEPMLDVLTRDFAADPFFRFLILHFGEKRCRFFCSDVKKHLVIMSNSPQHSAFLMTVFAKDHLEMRLIYKDHGETNNDWLAEVMDDPLRAQFDEIVRCAASFCWMEVVHSSPSGKIRT